MQPVYVHSERGNYIEITLHHFAKIILSKCFGCTYLVPITNYPFMVMQYEIN